MADKVNLRIRGKGAEDQGGGWKGLLQGPAYIDIWAQGQRGSVYSVDEGGGRGIPGDEGSSPPVGQAGCRVDEGYDA